MKKILVVDDSSTMRKIIRRTLRQTGLAFDDVLEAENGIEALSVLAGDPAIRVVLSDMNMPEMNGIELVTQLRTQQDATALGVVMVTTEKYANSLNWPPASPVKKASEVALAAAE